MQGVPVWEITPLLPYSNKRSPSFTSATHQHSAQTVLEENERIFTELLLSIERKYNEVKEMIRSHEKTTVTRAEIVLDRLEEEITLLRKRHNDLDKLSHTDDHIHFLQVRPRTRPPPCGAKIRGQCWGYICQVCLLSHLCLPPSSFFYFTLFNQSWQSLSGPSGYEDLNNTSVAPNYSFESTKRAIAALKLEVEEVGKTEMSKISGAGGQILSFLCSFLKALVSQHKRGVFFVSAVTFMKLIACLSRVPS